MCPKSTVFIPRVQSLSQEYILCPMGTVYFPRVQFMSHDYSLSPDDSVYVPRVQSLSQEYILCPKSINYVPRVQSLSQEYILCFPAQECSLFSRVQFISQQFPNSMCHVLCTKDYSLCPKSTVFIPRVHVMS